MSSAGLLPRHLRWHANLLKPRLALLPAEAFHQVRRRGERIGQAVDHVDAAVAVKVEAVLEIVRGRELRRPKLARPVANHLVRPQIAALDDAQHSHQLVAEERRAPAIVGQRRHRTDDVVGAALVGAVVAFQTPKRNHHRRRHSGRFLDAGQQSGVSLQLLQPVLIAADRGHAAGELQEALLKHALPAVAADDGRIECYAIQRGGDRPLRNAL